jgi:hypothetical protein
MSERRSTSDRDTRLLGMDSSITRRDFVNGALVGCAALSW